MSEHLCIDCAREQIPGVHVPASKIRKIVTADGEPKRCTTHLRRFKTRQRQQARGRAVERTYDISAKDAGELLVFQGGRCWICRKATGASKLLAVDHDHADDWVRGRLCSTCNQFIGRQLGDDPQKAARLIGYLSGDTPYRRMLAQRYLGPDRTVLGVGWSALSGLVVIVWQNPDGSQEDRHVPLDLLQSYAEPKS